MYIDNFNNENDEDFCFEGFLFGMTSEQANLYVKNGLREKGKSFITTLNGSFCGYFVDHRKNVVIVFNDRLGMKDLYLYHKQGKVAISNEFNEIVRLFKIDEVDFFAVGEMIKFQTPLFSKTFMKDVELCSAATIVEFKKNGGSPIKERYWLFNAHPVGESEKKLEEELSNIFKWAVEQSFFDPQKSFCIANSGGVDSRCNLFFSKQLNKTFTTYTYGDERSDAYHISSKIQKRLGLNQIFIPVDLAFLEKFSFPHLEKASMIPLNYSWYHSAYAYLRDYDVNITGFHSNFFHAFTHLDPSKKYNDLVNCSKEQQYRYNYNLHSVCPDDLMIKLFRDKRKVINYDQYQSGMDLLNSDNILDAFDEFEHENRGRRLTKNEPWMDYYQSMDVVCPMLHNEMVDFSLRLPLKYRLNKRLLINAMANSMGDLAKIRLERFPWGLKKPRGVEKKIKSFLWRVDNKLDKTIQKSFWYKGSHKNVRMWMANDVSMRYITDVFDEPNEIFDQLIDKDFIKQNLRHLIKHHFLVVGSLMSVKLYFDHLIKTRKSLV